MQVAPDHTASGRDLVTVDPIVAKLIPMFMENRTKDLELLEQLYCTQDFEAFQRQGHKLRGVGLSYGFMKLGALAGEIENAAKARDLVQIRQLIDEMSEHLRNVEITCQ